MPSGLKLPGRMMSPAAAEAIRKGNTRTNGLGPGADSTCTRTVAVLVGVAAVLGLAR